MVQYKGSVAKTREVRMAKRTMVVEIKDTGTVTEWNGFTTGDPIKVIGERGSFTFRYAQLDGDGETVKSICVVGGISGHSHFRHFLPERVKALPKRRARKTLIITEDE
jgi:hypothetical protein